MKDYLQLLAVFALILVLIPCVGYAKKHVGVQETSAEADGATVKILCEKTGEISEYSMEDYIIGAVFAQMPADFEDEALKAQAALASTYARRRILTESEQPDKSLHGAHLSDDSSRFQAFFTEDQARAVYGEEYDAAYEKISSAADYAKDLTLTYDGSPIMVAFHGISFGSTESALTMWGEDIPYLQAADSEWDGKLAQCETIVSYSEQEVKALLTGEYTDGDFSGEPSDWISIAERSESGTSLKVQTGGVLSDSGRFCDLLGLPSRHFSVSYEDGRFTFTVCGCGHLVGMSQYGANEMAKQGRGCEEILLHYFKDTVLVRAD